MNGFEIARARAFALAFFIVPYFVSSQQPAYAGAPPVSQAPEDRILWRGEGHRHSPSATLERVRQLIVISRREGDLRALGQAEAILQDYSANDDVDVKTLAAIIAQRNHDFDRARELLKEVVSHRPDHAQAWFSLYGVALTQGQYPLARQACAKLGVLGFSLIERSCHFNLLAFAGEPEAAFKGLREALQRNESASAVERAWAGATLAELAAVIDHPDTEALYHSALAQSPDDHYSAAGLADWYLQQNRPERALAVLSGRPASDRLDLLRLIAHRAQGEPAENLYQSLHRRLLTAQRRNSDIHRHEQARFLLEVENRPHKALVVAQDNFAEQKERADHRLLERARRAVAEGAEP